MTETVALSELDPLLEQRVTLCDLLWGRSYRLQAWQEMKEAIELEAIGAPYRVVTESLERVSHMEWIASITERGRVAHGGRINRCGSPEDS